MAGERCGRCGLPSSRDYVDGEAFCFHGTGRDSDKLACRDRELSRLSARLALAEAVIEAATRMRDEHVERVAYCTEFDAALQAFDSVSPGGSGGDSTGKEPTNSGR